MDTTRSGLTDHHIHTALCRHAEGGMQAFAEHAARVKLNGICFLDHLILNPIGRNQSMTADEVGLYFLAVQRLKQAYGNVIDIKVGLEIDFEPESMPRIEEIVGRFAFDVIGGSVHFIGGQNIVSRRFRREGTLTTRDRWERYIAQLTDMLDSGFFDMICHLDVPKKHGHPMPADLEDAFDEVLVNIAASGCAVEINTSGLDHPIGDLYPSLELIKKCRQLGIPFVLGSDAHRPDAVGRHFSTAVPLLRSLGIGSLSEFSGRNRRESPLPS